MQTEDRLRLVTADAASRLGVSKDWLRRHADCFPLQGAAPQPATSAPAWCLGSLPMRRTFTLLCKGCGRRIVESERIGEEEEATAGAHVAACFGLPRIPPRLEVLLTYVDVRVD